MWVVATANPTVLVLGVVVCLFLTIRFVVPFSRHFVTTTLPSVWIAARLFLVQPYLFFVVNFIILVIWILSERHNRHSSDKKQQPYETAVDTSTVSTPKDSKKVVPFETIVRFPSLPPSETKSEFSSVTCDELDDEYNFPPVISSPPEMKRAVLKKTTNVKSDTSRIICSDDEEYNFPPADTSPLEMKKNTTAESDTSQIVYADDQGYNVTPVVSIPRDMKEADDVNKGDLKTMDATWESIMAVSPAGKVLKKSETCKEAPRVENLKSPAITVITKNNADHSKMQKSESFKEGNSRRRAPVRRMEAAEIGSAELKLQYEAFIKRRHKQLLLERQESNQRYIDMINNDIHIIDH